MSAKVWPAPKAIPAPPEFILGIWRHNKSGRDYRTADLVYDATEERWSVLYSAMEGDYVGVPFTRIVDDFWARFTLIEARKPDLSPEYEAFLEKVDCMRRAQRRFFLAPSHDEKSLALADSKRLERDVDLVIAALRKSKLPEQGQLFANTPAKPGHA